MELILVSPSSVTNDAFRTLATDQDFKDKVSEEALVRLLDAFAWSHLGECAWTRMGAATVVASELIWALWSSVTRHLHLRSRWVEYPYLLVLGRGRG